MKNLIMLLAVFFTVTLGFAKDRFNPNDGRLNVFSNGQISVGEAVKIIKFKGVNLTVYVGVDFSNNISAINLSNNISKEDFLVIKSKILAANCFTTCSRANKCSDKPTMAGVIGCYAECSIDCIEEAIEEMQQEQSTNLT